LKLHKAAVPAAFFRIWSSGDRTQQNGMIGVIADDLTGAAELGGIGLRYGLQPEVVLEGKFNGDADLLCVDTDSRSCSAKEAARRAAAAARKLRKAGAVWIYKKVDSVLRGNVLAEVSAIREALGLHSALLVPANPRFGRVIRDGRYFVKGKPIHQTDFARDPEYPRRSPNVLKMLGVTKTLEVSVTRLAEYRPTSGIVLGEVSSSADVQKWASQRSEDMLLAGGAEFFEAVLKAMVAHNPEGIPSSSPGLRGTSYPGIDVSRVYNPERVASDGRRGPPPSKVHRQRTSVRTRELFICGSTSDYTLQFVNQAQRDGTPVFSIIERGNKESSLTASMLEAKAQEAITAFETHSRVVLAVGRPLIHGLIVARRLAQYLVKIAVCVLERGEVDRVYAEGGATAAEFVRQLGWSRLKVLRELAPGVTTLALAGRHSPVLTIKPGSYPGWPKLR
jgi:D-threonate/D-erythronate kinase